MDDLTRCLYEFVCERRMGSLYADKEYQETLQNVERQRERVEAHLDKEQRWELGRLIDDVASQSSIEMEYMFQASLALARELHALVRV